MLSILKAVNVQKLNVNSWHIGEMITRQLTVTGMTNVNCYM